jgi:hypothetical protein
MGDEQNTIKIKLLGLPLWLFSILVFLLFVANIILLKACWSGRLNVSDSSAIENLSENELKLAYLKAVKDAEIAEPAEISRELVPIVAHNPDLVWQGKRGESPISVVTWTAADKYEVGSQIAQGDVWVTVAPELKNFCRKLSLSSEKMTIRLKQLLGLPLKPHKTDMVEIWADPRDLFRPSPDPEITDREAGLDFPKSHKFLTVADDHIRWFNKNMCTSYTIDNYPYPWTRLGYTYDWGNPKSEIGLSEFVIKKGAPIKIHSVVNTEAYCN